MACDSEKFYLGKKMANIPLSDLLSEPCDCILLVHPDISMLENLSIEIQGLRISHLNISKELSSSLVNVSAGERSRFPHKWMVDTLATFQNDPVLCSTPDLLFDSSLKIDPLSLIRHVARIKKLIVLWPGEFDSNILSYAIPDHHHYRTWKITEDLLQQPSLKIHRISG